MLAVLDPETGDRISDVAENLGETLYTTLKERLLSSFSLSPWQAMWQLFDFSEMAEDQWPSLFLATMKALLPPEEKADSFTFRALFIRKLPEELRGPLISSKFDTVVAMAAHADTLWSARSIKPTQSRAAEASRADGQTPPPTTTCASTMPSLVRRPCGVTPPAATSCRETPWPPTTVINHHVRWRRSLLPDGHHLRKALPGRHRSGLQHSATPLQPAAGQPQAGSS